MSEFEKELRDLMKKHNVKVIEIENYDNEDNYLGSTYRFDGKGVFLSLEELEDN